MPQQRETTTNNLSDIIQLIQIGHRSGTLSVERGEGNTFEEGMINFVNGQITDAQTGVQRGPTALGRLTSWTTCRFSFTVGGPSQSQGTGPTSPIGSRSGPPSAPGYPNTRGLPPTTNPSIPRTHVSPAGSAAVFRIPYRTQMDSNAFAYIDQLGMTREHRRLYMLIDGQRSVQDLINLMGRAPEKLLELLADLERTGLIRHR
ncbi:hypothetical protein KDA_64290 [Dictyobacter alpinus]|uniref:PatA-like N-terminal domain-containing protein n=1 Tax=Dictyobacter alpinus TaxID=2014873 RepID=A0A402BHV8_9CHLR|nr:DUF4388 domain-containing protein [Dictyobacter alpinus]GCE30945.1 hypothetical protein KDA_64290 [Dictyobacter alpinus]